LLHVLAEHELTIGEVVLGEFRETLEGKFKLPVTTVEEIELFLREYEVVPRPKVPSKVKIRDPDDRWVLASAIEGHADILVSEDEDFLTLGSESPLRIVDPRGFWNIIRTSPPQK
jgi:putative PIN family toxin of toxin-antitoxin system